MRTANAARLTGAQARGRASAERRKAIHGGLAGGSSDGDLRRLLQPSNAAVPTDPCMVQCRTGRASSISTRATLYTTILRLEQAQPDEATPQPGG
jgi:hypothetical protein